MLLTNISQSNCRLGTSSNKLTYHSQANLHSDSEALALAPVTACNSSL